MEQRFRYAFNKIWFDWEGNEKAIIIDPDNQTNKNNINKFLNMKILQ